MLRDYEKKESKQSNARNLTSMNNDINLKSIGINACLSWMSTTNGEYCPVATIVIESFI